jgi:hypothetical protein
MNFFFYPTLLHYQAGSEAAFYANRLPPGEPVGLYGEDSYSFAFYTKAPVHYWQLTDLQNTLVPVLIFTRRDLLDSLRAGGLAVEALHDFPHFHISQLTGAFINYNTRETATTAFALARIRPRFFQKR